MSIENDLNNSRLFCLILTVEDASHNKQAKAVNRTWARRCDHVAYSSNVNQSQSLPIIYVGESSKNKSRIVHRLFKTLRIIYIDMAHKFDWLYVADDDTYAIIENLRHFLSEKNPLDHGYFGFEYGPTHLEHKGKKLTFAHGGSGFVLSKHTLRSFSINGYINEKLGKCHPLLLKERHDEHGDVNVGLCLLKLGILAGKTRVSNHTPYEQTLQRRLTGSTKVL